MGFISTCGLGVGVGLPGPWITRLGLTLESVVMALGPGSISANLDLGPQGPASGSMGTNLVLGAAQSLVLKTPV